MSSDPAVAMPGLSHRVLLDYTGIENERWRTWFAARPAGVLDVAIGDPPIATVRQLVRHIAFVEHRYAAILTGTAVPAATGSDADGVDALFTYLADGRRLLEGAIAESAESGLDRTIEFMTLTQGLLRASAGKVIGHALLHGIRHWAQLATLLRERGHRTDWPHDFGLSPAMR